MSDHDRTFSGDFKRFFGRGLTVLLPSILTLWILWHAALFVFNNVAEPINKGMRGVVLYAVPVAVQEGSRPQWYRLDAADERAIEARVQERRGPLNERAREALRRSYRHQIRAERLKEYWDAHWYLQGTGLVMAIILIYLAGLLLGGYIGRKVYSRVEALIARVPGFKQIYPHVKQLVDLIIGERPIAFKRVVLVQYPRQGLWTLGLVTSNSLKSVTERVGGPAITIFIPSTPTPFTGFTINVPEAEVIDLPVTIDEALRFVLTGGVLIPDKEAHDPSDLRVGDLGRRAGGGAVLPPAAPATAAGPPAAAREPH